MLPFALPCIVTCAKVPVNLLKSVSIFGHHECLDTITENYAVTLKATVRRYLSILSQSYHVFSLWSVELTDFLRTDQIKEAAIQPVIITHGSLAMNEKMPPLYIIGLSDTECREATNNQTSIF